MERYVSLFRPMRSSLRSSNLFPDLGPRAQAWDIGFLATAPAHQGAGRGKALMQYGIRKATEEQVPLSVISAYGKDGFYQKLGFVIPDGTAADGEGNPLNGLLKGGKIWWKEDHLTEKR